MIETITQFYIYIVIACVISAAILLVIGTCYDVQPKYIVSGFGLIVCVLLTLMFVTPPPEPTGEIIKMFANGTGLLDNGTLIQLSDVPGFGSGK